MTTNPLAEVDALLEAAKGLPRGRWQSFSDFWFNGEGRYRQRDTEAVILEGDASKEVIAWTGFDSSEFRPARVKIARFVALAKNAIPSIRALRREIEMRDRVIVAMGQALDTADRLTERAFGIDRATLHPEWDREFKTVARMRSKLSTLSETGK